MAQLVLTDKFIVDRGGSTYKTTFEDIQSSLDLAYTYTGAVQEEPGGRITSYSVTKKGLYFLAGDVVEFTDGNELGATVYVAEIGPGGTIEATELSGNTAGFPEDQITVLNGNPFSTVGEIKSISNLAAPTNYLENTTADFNIYQAPWLEPNPDFGTPEAPDAPEFFERFPAGGIARVTGMGDGNEPLIELISRGSDYRNSADGDDGSPIDTYLERSILGAPDDAYKINLVAVDTDDIDDTTNHAEITVDGVANGSDSDKILLTVQIGSDESTAQTVTLVPGRGIEFKNTDEDNEIEILSTIDSGGNIGGGGGGSSSALVIIAPQAPTEPTYELSNGSLWFNTSDGRLYVAVTFPTDTGYAVEWIDASPSSFNDALRKNQNDSTDYTIDVNNSLYAQHFALERLPLIEDAP